MKTVGTSAFAKGISAKNSTYTINININDIYSRGSPPPRALATPKPPITNTHHTHISRI